MERLQAEMFVRALQGDDLDDRQAKLYDKYSGRGMFGKETIGVITSCPRSQLRDRLDEVRDARNHECDALESVTQAQGVQQTVASNITSYDRRSKS